MATAKFKDDSPYLKKTQPAAEDYLYAKYVKDCAMKGDKSKDRVIGVAIFGLGRAGTIHFSNLINNSRAKILYIVDDLECKSADIKQYWNLENVIILHSKDADRVYKDPK
ncbi:uncharacterized protein LOC106646190 [Copidosoma floridanum]|uniref:uncharacterized protein LOC106646190 n=1 Tax=Copidosoma floridanum TaxID=29053 RepID=UPI0006C9C36E|nr:uncharacterized protein LOC106646190 [Copidosoma floridanum]